MGNHSAKYIIGVKRRKPQGQTPKGSAPKYKNGREHVMGDRGRNSGKRPNSRMGGEKK